MSTARLLTNSEKCARKGYWSLKWQAHKLTPVQMIEAALRHALCAKDGAPWGELAGSEILQLAEDRGMEIDTPRLYESVIHHAALADLIATVLRKPGEAPWSIPADKDGWQSDCYLSPDGSTLRRVILVSHWNDERHYSECRSWYSLGEIAAYELPMQMAVFVIGQLRDGKRSSPWTTGFLHPSGNHVLRFRKKSKSTSEVFSEKWQKIYREDHAEISREAWIESMLKDDVLPEVAFPIHLPVPPDLPLRRIRDMMKTKLERLNTLTVTPEASLSVCEWPVKCEFLKLCHTLPEREPQARYGFDRA